MHHSPDFGIEKQNPDPVMTLFTDADHIARIVFVFRIRKIVTEQIVFGFLVVDVVHQAAAVGTANGRMLFSFRIGAFLFGQKKELPVLGPAQS